MLISLTTTVAGFIHAGIGDPGEQLI